MAVPGPPGSGKLYDMRVYGTVLTPAEIVAAQHRR
jgi:hypothetical protein